LGRALPESPPISAASTPKPEIVHIIEAHRHIAGVFAKDARTKDD
jgi:hypothetical protein